MMQKWNYTTRRYEPYSVPADWVTPLGCDDMAAEINCAACGRKIQYGQSYVSLAIHNRAGFGYPVCEDCYNAELKQERGEE